MSGYALSDESLNREHRWTAAHRSTRSDLRRPRHSAETVGFDQDPTGSPPCGLGMRLSRAAARPSGQSRARHRAQQTERVEAIWPRHISLVREEGRLPRRRLRRGQVQADGGQGRPRRRCHLALEGRRQLLRGAGQCSGEQRFALPHDARQPAHDQVRRCARAANQWHTLRVEFAGKRVERHPGRQAIHRRRG